MNIREAYYTLSFQQRKEIKRELMRVLGVKTNASITNYLMGRRIPRADKANEIINLFAEHGLAVKF